MRNPGRIIELTDGRKCIVYDRQPLANQKEKVIMHLVDDKYNLIIDEKSKKPKILIKDIPIYNQMKAKLIGYVD